MKFLNKGNVFFIMRDIVRLFFVINFFCFYDHFGFEYRNRERVRCVALNRYCRSIFLRLGMSVWRAQLFHG